MINVSYRGQNYIIFGNIKIKGGVNPIPEEDFYRLMKDQFFRARLEKGIFTVPPGTPLEKPKTNKKDQKMEEKNPIDDVEEVKDSKKKSKEKESEKRFDEIV